MPMVRTIFLIFAALLVMTDARSLDGGVGALLAVHNQNFLVALPLATYGSQPATTTWQTDPATGLVLAKQTQDGKLVKYAYDAAGAVVKRKWARGITTTVARNAASGDVTGVSHDDNATFSVAYGNHDVFGRPGMITETRNGVASTTSLTYSASSGAGSVTYSEDHPFLPKVALSVNGDDIRGRSTGHSVTLDGNIIHSWTHGYDSLGRLGSVTGHGMTSTLDYYPGTGMLQSQTIRKADTTKVLQRDHNIDLLGRTYGVINRGGDTNDLVASVAHTYDAANRRSTARREDGAKWTYGYNTRSEVTAAAKSLDDATAIPGLEFGYNYDGIGNRLTASKGNPAITTAYTPDAMNRYGTITTPGADDILVRSGVPVGIAANGQAGTVTTAGSLHNGRVAVDNDPDGAWANIAVTATGFSDTGHRWVPPASVIPSYDDDGNLLADGRWTYTWDAMNRLVAMAPTPNALAAGVPNQTITFAYDFASRRIGKKVTTTSGTGTTVKDTRYLYDGWSRGARRDPRQTADRRPGGRERNGVPLSSTCVAEFEYDELDGLIPKATYLWSLDLSGTLQGAGGVGGLLSVSLLSSVSASSVFLPCYDANGNIIAWADGNGSPAQRQDYDPFGNLVIVERLAITPAAAARLAYGFSTKPLDAETGLHYYGFRFYDGRNGRWINQDPIGENGGINLYGFVGNGGTLAIDHIGLYAAETLRKICCCRDAIKKYSSNLAVPALAVAGAIAEEFDTRINLYPNVRLNPILKKGDIDDSMDDAMQHVNEAELERSAFGVFVPNSAGSGIYAKFMSYDAWDIGPANMRWSEVKRLHDAYHSNDGRTRRNLVRHLLTCEGTSEYVALYISEIQDGLSGVFEKYATPPDTDYKIAGFVTAFRQGTSYLDRYVDGQLKIDKMFPQKKITDERRIQPGEGQNVITFKTDLEKALSGEFCGNPGGEK